jgi:hypothetical protein
MRGVFFEQLRSYMVSQEKTIFPEDLFAQMSINTQKAVVIITDT